jgi:predicted RNase H-like HicB family nuclease
MNSLANVLDQPCVHIRLWREDGIWIAKCLEIPGCISEGGTREEALENVHDAIVLCLDVISEDARRTGGSEPTVEVIERPIEEFLRAS